MKSKGVLPILLLILLFSAFVPNAFARGGTFVIGPMREGMEKVESQVSDSGHTDLCGNLSVLNDGFIDFYVTDPSGNVLLKYNKTSSLELNFTMTERGVYIMHMINTFANDNVTVVLNYGLNVYIVLQGSVHTSFSTSTTTQTIAILPGPSVDIWQILVQIGDVLGGLGAVIGSMIGLLKILGQIKWKLKYRKPRTPSDFPHT